LEPRNWPRYRRGPRYWSNRPDPGEVPRAGHGSIVVLESCPISGEHTLPSSRSGGPAPASGRSRRQSRVMASGKRRTGDKCQHARTMMAGRFLSTDRPLYFRHCEERSDEAISSTSRHLDCVSGVLFIGRSLRRPVGLARRVQTCRAATDEVARLDAR